MITQAVIRRLAREREHAKLIVLAYHKILPMTLGENVAGTKVEALRAQLSWLGKMFDVLPIHEAVQNCRAGKLHRPTACITFDDGYATQCSIAVELLLELDLPATFFVTTGHNEDKLLWNDALQLFLDQASSAQRIEFARLMGVPTADCIAGSALLTSRELERQTKYLSIMDRAAALDFARAETHTQCGGKIMMNDDDVRNLSTHGFEVGGHTVDHPILSIEKPEEAELQIVQGLERLARLVGKPITSFAFPNGKPGSDYGNEHLAMLSRNGIEVALTSALGHFAPGRDPLQIARVVFEGSSRFNFVRTLRGAYITDYNIISSRGYEAIN